MDELDAIQADIEAVARVEIVPTILDVVCRITRMRFAAVARVTDARWVTCAVKDDLQFGLVPGAELRLETTICNEIRQHGKPVVIDDVSAHPTFCSHPTPAMYGFRSYISLPITLPNGAFFGTLCAIDREPARVETPEVVGMFTAFAELIALHLAGQQRLDQTTASLADERRNSELREQFMAVLGHDLRVPLAAVTSGAEVLARGAADEHTAGVVRMIQRSVRRMSGLIDNIVDFARGRLGGGLRLDRQAANLGPVLQQVVEDLRSAWPERTLDVQLDLPRPVDCDHHRVGMLVANLLANALDHGTPRTPVRLAACMRHGNLELTVANAGEQLPSPILTRLFQPFVRAAGGSQQRGLGLGLYIASEIARAHGGTLAVASGAGQLSFTFTMPLR